MARHIKEHPMIAYILIFLIILLTFLLLDRSPEIETNRRELWENQEHITMEDIPELRLNWEALLPDDLSFVNERYAERDEPSAVLTELLSEQETVGLGEQVSPAQPSGSIVELDEISRLVKITVSPGLYNDRREELDIKTKQALQYVIGVTGITPEQPFMANYVANDCLLHGRATTQSRFVEVYGCNSTNLDNMVVIMAHEFVHQLQHDRYNNHLGSDMALMEGFATWGAGQYWRGQHPSFKSMVQSSGAYNMITDSPYGNVNRMNTAYMQWASLIEYILQRWDRQTFDRLYETGATSPGTADYQGVLGISFDQLVSDWSNWVQS
ncbi:MAG: hypothetical protein ACOCXQ_04550 [Patescibacteria group bacterium]